MNKLTKGLLASVSLAALAAMGAGGAKADVQATPVTQTATHNDAAVFWVGPGAGHTACDTVSGTPASDTVTITPPAGNYVYLTSLTEQVSTDATGVTQTGTISFTNIGSAGQASPYLTFGTALSTTGADTIDMVIPFPHALKSAQPGVAVTIVPSTTQSAHNYLCLSAIGYFNQN